MCQCVYFTFGDQEEIREGSKSRILKKKRKCKGI